MERGEERRGGEYLEWGEERIGGAVDQISWVLTGCDQAAASTATKKGFTLEGTHASTKTLVMQFPQIPNLQIMMLLILWQDGSPMISFNAIMTLKSLVPTTT